MKAIVFNFILKLTQQLSLQSGRSLAVFFGSLMWRLSRKHKHITLTNITQCYPKLTRKKQEQRAKLSINAALMNFFELGCLWNKKTKVESFIDNIYGIETFQEALDKQQGLLLAVPHMGNWEVLNLVLAQFDKFAFLYKPPSDKKIENLLVKYRGKSKALQIEANLKGVRKIMTHLKSNGFIAILPDQKPKSGQGVFSPFYGVDTYTMTLFSKLAVKTKVPVFFAFALRTQNGFTVHFEKSDDKIYENVNTSVAYMNNKIQKIVDKAPEQYQWTYKRFSIQVEGKPPFY